MTLQNLLDVKLIADQWSLLQLGFLKWTREQNQRFFSFVGLGFIAGPHITATGVGNLGPHGHTTLAHLVTILADLLLGFLPSSESMLGAGLMNWIGDQRSHCLKQMATIIALNTGGFRKGELS